MHVQTAVSNPWSEWRREFLSCHETVERLHFLTEILWWDENSRKKWLELIRPMMHRSSVRLFQHVAAMQHTICSYFSSKRLFERHCLRGETGITQYSFIMRRKPLIWAAYGGETQITSTPAIVVLYIARETGESLVQRYGVFALRLHVQSHWSKHTPAFNPPRLWRSLTAWPKPGYQQE